MQQLTSLSAQIRQAPITFSRSNIGGLNSEEIVQITWGELGQPIWSLEIQSGAFCIPAFRTTTPPQKTKQQKKQTGFL